MTEEELARHDSKTLLQLLLSADARCEALTAERDEARKKFNDTDLCWNGVAPCGWSLTLIDKADTAEAERDRLRSVIEYVLDGYGLKGPDYRFQDGEDGDWISDRLVAALKGESHE